MTTIDDNLKLIEGTNQSYGKLYANDSKELHYVDSGGNDTNLTNVGDFVSNTTFTENKNAQNEINHAIIQSLDGYSVVGSNIQQVYTITAAVSRTSTGDFTTYTIPANTLQVGSTITVLANGIVSSYSSGIARFSVSINGVLIADDNATTPATGWFFYGHGSATVYSTGSSGSMARGGIGITGVQGTRSSTSNIPVLIGDINTIDTTQGIDVKFSCAITGTMTLEATQFTVIMA